MQDPLIGKEIDNGEFRITERVGSGGMGSVYKAEQPSMNRMVAIKVLHAKFLSRGDLVSRFRREARAMSQLSHPNTAHVYKFGQLDDGSCYFVMDYLVGQNLAQKVRAEGPMDPNPAINIMVQVCGALEEAHQAGIIHRDMKPENIFLTDQGGAVDFPKVLDFGLAKVTEKQMGFKSLMNLTQQGTIFGTPEFMSPEQALGAPLDRRSDIYSLGVIMYEMLTTKLPFDATGKRQIMTAQVHAPPIPLSKRAPDRKYPANLESVLFKALAKNPAERYQSAAEFAHALKGCATVSLTTQANLAMARVPSVRPAAPHSAVETATKYPEIEDDPPQLPISRTPYLVLAAGVILAIVGIIALLISLFRR